MASLEVAPGRGSGPTLERARTKCDYCRKKKCKCNPSDRDWSNGEKCFPCQKSRLPCGPNIPSSRCLLPPHSSGQGSQLSPTATTSSTSPSSKVEFLQLQSSQHHTSTAHERDVDVSLVSIDPSANVTTTSVTKVNLSPSPTATVNRKSEDNHSLSERLTRLGLARIALENIHGLQRSIGPHVSTQEGNEVQQNVKVRLLVYEYCVAREYNGIFQDLMAVAKQASTTMAKSIYLETLDEINSMGTEMEQFSKIKVHLLQELLLIYQEEGNLPAVERMLKHLSNQKHSANSDCTGDVTALLAQCFVTISPQIRDLLQNLHLDTSPSIHFPPLHRALRGDNDDVARFLGQETAAVKELDMLRQNAVIAAATTGKAALLEPIFREDPQLLTERDILARSALFHAAHQGDFGSYLTLVDAGADIYHRDSSTQSILGAAAAAGSTEIVRDLLDRGVDPNDHIHLQSTPLYEAAKAGHHEVVRLLLAKGAWVDLLVNSKTAAQVASENGLQAIAEMIQEATFRPENNFRPLLP